MLRIPPRYAVLVGGLTAATLDISYAVIFSGLHGYAPMRVLQSVASGLLGRAAYEGGLATAVLGVLLHYSIMLAAACVFFLARRRLAVMGRQPFLAACVFGVGMDAMMNLVILPLSAFPGKVSFAPDLLAFNLAAHILLVGVPISYALQQAGARAAPAR